MLEVGRANYCYNKFIVNENSELIAVGFRERGQSKFRPAFDYSEYGMVVYPPKFEALLSAVRDTATW